MLLLVKAELRAQCRGIRLHYCQRYASSGCIRLSRRATRKLALPCPSQIFPTPPALWVPEQETRRCNNGRPKACSQALLKCPLNCQTAPILFLSGLGAPPCPRPQDAYVALLRPEDVAAGVGACFTAALAQLSGLQDAAAEDVMVRGRAGGRARGRGRSLMSARSCMRVLSAGRGGGGRHGGARGEQEGKGEEGLLRF